LIYSKTNKTRAHEFVLILFVSMNYCCVVAMLFLSFWHGW